MFGLAFFVRAKGNRAVYLGVLVLFTVLLGGTLYMIADLDSPFSGVHKLNQTEMSRIQTSLETSYTRLAPGTPLPCTSDGVKLGPARELPETARNFADA